MLRGLTATVSRERPHAGCCQSTRLHHTHVSPGRNYATDSYDYATSISGGSVPPVACRTPNWQWTRKVAAKTICRWLSADQHHDYQAWIDNDRRLRELLARLEALGTAALEADPRWQRHGRNQAH